MPKKYAVTEQRPDNPIYERWMRAIQLGFLAQTRSEALFQTTLYGQDLYATFLAELPEADRQYHTCAACREFMNTYGTLVVITERGLLKSPFWSPEDGYTPDYYRNAVDAVRHRAISAHVTQPFYTNKLTWGTPPAANGDAHFMAQPNATASYIWRDKPLSIAQQTALRKRQFAALKGETERYDLAALRGARLLLQGRPEFRQAEVTQTNQQLLEVAQTNTWIRPERRKQRTNMVWRLLSKYEQYPTAKRTVLGGLLDDLAAGMSQDVARARHLARVNRLPAERVAPVVADHEVARQYQPALRRRFARLDELQLLWQRGAIADPQANNPYRGRLRANVRAELRLSFAQFRAEILPQVARIEFQARPARYVAFVAPVKFNAPPIYVWDDDPRCPYSWYVYGEDSAPENWNLPTRVWVAVTGIALRPQMWHHPERYLNFNTGVAFILNGCVDNNNRRSALFMDELRPELQPIQDALRNYSHDTPLLGREQASACGVRFNENAAPLTLRVYYTDGGDRQPVTLTSWQ